MGFLMSGILQLLTMDSIDRHYRIRREPRSLQFVCEPQEFAGLLCGPLRKDVDAQMTPQQAPKIITPSRASAAVGRSGVIQNMIAAQAAPSPGDTLTNTPRFRFLKAISTGRNIATTQTRTGKAKYVRYVIIMVSKPSELIPRFFMMAKIAMDKGTVSITLNMYTIKLMIHPHLGRLARI
jgi:hypothetical protein